MTAILWNFFSFILALAILIAVHEWGHFWVARRCGVRVERFSLGFGKVLFSRKDKLGTEFSLSLIPLGGYVKMLDERVDPVPAELKSQAFNNKAVWQRFAIVAAGPADVAARINASRITASTGSGFASLAFSSMRRTTMA